jgi:hypothetical protein
MVLRGLFKYHSAPARYFPFREIQAWGRLKILLYVLVSFLLPSKYRSAPGRFFPFKVKIE